MFGREVSIEDIFVVVTDDKDTIVHFSENCMK
jgi:hypothetical protein